MTPTDAFPRTPVRLAAMISIAVLVSGCNRAAKPGEEKVPPAPVKWEEPRQLFLEEWTELVGTTQPLPDHAARVTTPVEGRVVSVLRGGDGKPVEEGQEVGEGDTLVRLDTSALTANKEKAEAAKKVLQAEREGAEVGVKQAALEVRRLEELRRQDTAGRSPSVSPVEIERAGLILDAARAVLRAADRKLEAADKEDGVLDQQIKLHTLTAPRKGRLGRLMVVTGQTLAVGAPVAEVIDIKDEIDVLCFVPSTEARQLQLGQSARLGGVEKDAASDQSADPEGKVVFVADHAEAETGLYAVKLRFPNGDAKLRSGGVARVRVLTKPGKACWAVPEAALLEDQDPPGIVIAEEVATAKNADGKDEQSGKARRLRAVIGTRDRVLHQVEILRLEDPEKKWQGDLEHALIIVEKGLSLQTGDAVKLEEEEDEEAPMPGEKP
jgi:RND family efflux transporter MFP subunit